MSGQQQDRAGAPSRACLRSWTAGEADVQAVLSAFSAPDMTGQARAPIATAAGFTREGIERQKLRYQDDDGTWQRFDTALWARLATDPLPDTVALEILQSEPISPADANARA